MVWLLLAVAVFAAFLTLGIWQVQRLHWKLALIERIEQRVQAAAVAAPAPSEWPAISRESSEYRHVQAVGRFDYNRETLVRASTELGRGFWVVTPLQTSAGFWILVNRGFVASADSARASRPVSDAPQTISGLLRISEPNGSLLQHNDPASGHWYSRDVPAISASIHLNTGSASTASVAPYFIDAEATADAEAWPRGGLTVLSFNNNHAVYAFTWLLLAAMVAVAAVYLWNFERQLRKFSASGKQATLNA